ncbi:MAG: Bacterial domain [Ilumatobacteraceae bacterium]|nr:Bacterial domain [Ilumatobacteraceae bacterium]
MHCARVKAAGVDLKAEIGRRRKVVLITGVALCFVAARGVLQLSSSNQVRMQDMCRTVTTIGGTQPVTWNFPCHPHDISSFESWRWPATLVVVGLIGALVGIVWYLMPRLAIVTPWTGEVAPAEGRRRGLTVRYRMSRSSWWLMIILGVPFLVGGLLLAILPTGTPFLIEAMFCGIGLLILYGADAGSASVSPEGLTVRMLLGRRHWAWPEIDAVDAVDGFAGPARVTARFVAVHTVDGSTWKNGVLASTLKPRGASRADQMAAAIEAYRQDLAATVHESERLHAEQRD